VGYNVETSLLLQELEPLNAQIEETQGKLKELEKAMSGVEAELETFSADQQRFEALQEVCNALDKLDQLEGGGLFWDGLPVVEDIAAHLEGLRHRIAQFEEEIRGSREKQESIKEQIEQCLDDLWDLEEEVRLAHAREERRQDEFVIEREASQVPYSPAIMPWTYDGESERAFRRALAVAMLLCLFFGSGIPMVNVPLPERAVVIEIPKRLATLVKKEPPKPEPVREVKKPEKAEEEEKLASESEPKKTDKKQKQQVQEEPKVAAAQGDGKQAARKKAEKVGVLAFKSSFSDLMEEVPVARLGVEAHLSKAPTGAPGQAQARRSLVAMEARGGSGGIGGIGNGGYSRNVGIGGGGGGSGTGFGSVGIARVESSVAGLVEEKGRPLSDGPAPGRTDEEIQIVFDRYKATLYRIYNTELRKDPTLRGKILLRITIEPSGELSLCKVESTDLDSPDLVAKIVARVKRFNFGPKEDVLKTTILYPIDFLPAG
jgi:hypothetical protein